MRLTFVTFTVGVAAISGLPFLADFFSKDAILFLAFSNNRAVFGVLAFTAALTAFYMVRLWCLVFLGRRAQRGRPATPTRAARACRFPWWFWPFSPPWADTPAFIRGLLRVCSTLSRRRVAGMRGSYWRQVSRSWRRGRGWGGQCTGARRGALGAAPATDPLQERAPGLFGVLVALQRSFDAAYDYYIEKIQQRFAMLLNFIDIIGLAGLVVRGLAGLAGMAGLGARAVHVGRLSVYLYWFLAGMIVLWAFAAGIL